MLPLTSDRVQQRCLWQSVIASAFVLVLFIILAAPVPAFAAELDMGTSGAAIASSTDAGSRGPTGVALDDELIQHAHCVHSVARVSFKTLPVRRLTSDAPLPREADLQPSRALSSLPFKPPRSA